MIIYSGTKDKFLDDVTNKSLSDIIEDAVRSKMGSNPKFGEIISWKNSLPWMGLILSQTPIPGDAGVAIEYNIPDTRRRVDMIISGLDSDGKNSAVIIELKQWQSCKFVPKKPTVVVTHYIDGEKEVNHPSYQASSYAKAISNCLVDVQNGNIRLQPCAYLHNYVIQDPDPLLDNIYKPCIDEAPIFTRCDGYKLSSFISDHIIYGDCLQTISMIEHGKLRPSRSLQDCIASMMDGNEEFIMIDEQNVAYENIAYHMRSIRGRDKKRTIIVKGGPGTGKSVIAVNLLATFVKEGLNAFFVSKTRAPRYVYEAKIKNSKKDSDIDSLFKWSGLFTDTGANKYDALLIDEAHRLNYKSFRKGENQVKELINASKLSVFFIDEGQRVSYNDMGTVEEIRKFAELFGSEVFEYELVSQFRCLGSDRYLEWLDSILQICDTASLDWPEPFDYDFRVFDDPCQMKDEIFRLNEGTNKSRILAATCWEWNDTGKNNTNIHDITIPGTDFEMSWNLGNTDTWAIDQNSVNEVGSVHTCQGLEFEYVGVILGPDISYDPETDRVNTDYLARSKGDRSIHGLKSHKPKEERQVIGDQIIRNTYKVLMSRGMKGCFVYCTDPNLRDYIKRRLDMVKG